MFKSPNFLINQWTSVCLTFAIHTRVAVVMAIPYINTECYSLVMGEGLAAFLPTARGRLGDVVGVIDGARHLLGVVDRAGYLLCIVDRTRHLCDVFHGAGHLLCVVLGARDSVHVIHQTGSGHRLIHQPGHAVGLVVVMAVVTRLLTLQR